LLLVVVVVVVVVGWYASDQYFTFIKPSTIRHRISPPMVLAAFNRELTSIRKSVFEQGISHYVRKTILLAKK
jgi:hypothetical protein